MAENKTNFCKLMKEKNIIIPIIQRDYVQGKDTSKIKSIRENLIRDMQKAFESGQAIDFQYIYGINKEGDVFLPIDGQQRLTSMYLFTWYVALASGKEGEEKLCEFKKFSYQVRSTSEAFFDELSRTITDDAGKRTLAHYEDFKAYIASEKKLTDCAWFKSKWKSDQTVRSVLKFLDSIKQAFERSFPNGGIEEKTTEMIKQLFDEANCPFQFFRIAQNENVDISGLNEKEKQDEAFHAENRAATTYINMNARGKVLNDFENLKALMHKCFKTNDNQEIETVGENFLDAYETRYIHIFHSQISQTGQADSFEGIISKMDALALKLLLNIYNDLSALEESKEKEIKDVYEFMNRIKEKAFDCDKIFPTDYFDFIEYLMNRVESENPQTERIFYNYCMNGRGGNRWNLFVNYWCLYRLEKKGISKDGWNVFCRHLCIKEDVKSWSEKQNGIRILNRILDALEEKKTVEEFLENVDVSEFLKYVCGKESGESSLNLTYARILEEKIKAGIYLANNSDATCGENLEKFGENRKHQIRYLLYLAGYYDKNGDYNKNGDYEKLKKYATYDKYVTNDEGLLWRKAFYMSGDFGNCPSKPVPPKCITKWNEEEILYWQGSEIPRDELERIRSIFETLERKGWSVKDLVEDYQGSYQDISCWLYYLLKRNISELLDNPVECCEKGKYAFGVRNYFEYILSQDLIKNGYEPMAKRIMPSKPYFGASISPRDGDGYVNNRSPELRINVSYETILPNTMIKDENIIYQFVFSGFDDKSKNNEDQFLWREDTDYIQNFECARKSVECEIWSAWTRLNRNEDDLYALIFRGDVSKLDLSNLEKKPYKDIWKVTSKKRVGSNCIDIEIEYRVKPFTNNPPIVTRNHSELI